MQAHDIRSINEFPYIIYARTTSKHNKRLDRESIIL